MNVPVLIIEVLRSYCSPHQDLKVPISWETGHTESKEENKSHRESEIAYAFLVEI